VLSLHKILWVFATRTNTGQVEMSARRTDASGQSKGKPRPKDNKGWQDAD
jgi:hypothetical protein